HRLREREHGHGIGAAQPRAARGGLRRAARRPRLARPLLPQPRARRDHALLRAPRARPGLASRLPSPRARREDPRRGSVRSRPAPGGGGARRGGGGGPRRPLLLRAADDSRAARRAIGAAELMPAGYRPASSSA